MIKHREEERILRPLEHLKYEIKKENEKMSRKREKQ